MVLPSLDSGTSRGLVVGATPLLLYPGEIDHLCIVQEAGLALGTGLDGSGKSYLTRVQTPDPPACSKLL
jgi:hypothetical protein